MKEGKVGWSESSTVCIDPLTVTTVLPPNKMDLHWQPIYSVIRQGTLFAPQLKLNTFQSGAKKDKFHPPLSSQASSTASNFMFISLWLPFFSKLFTHEPLCINCLHFRVSDGPPVPALKCQGEMQEGAELCPNRRDADCGVNGGVPGNLDYN